MLLSLGIVLLVAGVSCDAAVTSKYFSPDLSEGLSCHIDEIQYLDPKECVKLDKEERKVKHGGYCHVDVNPNNIDDVDLEMLRNGFLRCDNGHWSGTRSAADEFGHRHRRCAAGYLVLIFLLPFIGCLLFCSQCSSVPTVSKYPPTFSDPCIPKELEDNYNVEAGKTSIKVTWTPPEATDRNGDTPRVIQVYGDKSGSAFEGAINGKDHTIKYKATDSDGLADTCVFTFSVTILTCDSLPWPENGKLKCENGISLGSSCDYSCNTGYQLIGNSTVTCQNQTSPEWSSTPTCEKVTCAPPLAPKNGFLQCEGLNHKQLEYQTTCSVICDEGFGLQGQTYMQCTANRTWSNSDSASCLDDAAPILKCKTPQVFFADRTEFSTVVTWRLPTATDNTDPNPSIVKIEGPEPGVMLNVGSTVVKYKAQDANGNQSPECAIELRVEEITCGHPHDTLSGSFIAFSCSHSRYIYGTECNVSCNANLPLEGNDTITCERNESVGVWNWGTGDKPFCQEIACPELEPPINGALVYDTVYTRPIYTMMCNAEYDIPNMGTNFNGLFVCTDEGNWLPADVPDCVEHHIPGRLKLPAKIFYYRGDCGTADTLEQIKDNFQTILDTGLNPYFSGICPVGETCRAENIVVKCGPVQGRKRRTADVYKDKNLQLVKSVRETMTEAKKDHRIKRRQSDTQLLVIEFEIVVELKLGNQSLPAVIDYYDNITLNILKPAIQQLVENGTFDIPNSTLKSDSFQTPAYGDIECEPGYLLDGIVCKPCPLGFFLNDTNGKCQQCTVGEYKDVENQATCTPCPEGYSTKEAGSKSSNECIKLCSAGSYSPDALESCSPCLRGYYQDEQGQTSCKRCPNGTTTILTNSSSSTDCQYFDVLLEDMADTIALADSLDLITWMFWTKRSSSEETYTELRLTNNIDIVFYLSDKIQIDIESPVLKTVRDLEGNRWYHLSVVLDNSVGNATVYIDGKAEFTNSVSVKSPSTLSQGADLNINASGSSGVYITGLHIYNTTMSQSEVATFASACHVTEQNDVLNMAAFIGRAVTITTPSSCDAVDECRTSPCNGQQCINGLNGYSCLCDKGWSGKQCNVPPDYCVGNECENGATCVTHKSNYSCQCLPGYSGFFCEISPTDGSWSSWSSWTECSRTCGSGSRLRTRVCDSPVPGLYGRPCIGDSTENLTCNTEDCPVSDGLREFTTALAALEKTAQYLRNYTSSVFDVTNGNMAYTIDTSSLVFVPVVKCVDGRTAEEGVCYECPAGAYLGDEACKFCEKGTYQPATGQLSCIPCPSDVTTLTIGATDSTQCTELIVGYDEEETEDNFQKDMTDVYTAIGVAVAVVVVATVIIIVVRKKVIRSSSVSAERVIGIKYEVNRKPYFKDVLMFKSPPVPEQITLSGLDDFNDPLPRSDDPHTPLPSDGVQNLAYSSDNGSSECPNSYNPTPPLTTMPE